MEGIENLCKRIGQRWTIDLTKVEYKGAYNEADVRKYERDGHHVLIMFDGKNDNVYISKKTDGLVREPLGTWNRNVKLFPYEQNQKIWDRNIRWWFKQAISDNEYIDDLLSIFPDQDVLKIMGEARDELASFEVKNYGGRKGQRTSNIEEFLMNKFK